MRVLGRFKVLSAMAVMLCVGCNDNGSNTAGRDTPTHYTLSIEINPIDGGDVLREPSNTTYPAGQWVDVTAQANSGYEFVKWSGVSNETSPTVSVEMKSNLTLTANFRLRTGPQPDQYTVSFSANGGSGTAPSAQTVDAGSAITLPNQGSLTRSGYTFDGWNTNSSGTGNNYNAGSPYTPTASITLYAKWNTSSGGGGTTFTDSRDGKTYKKVTIGTQTWMGENLNYDVPGVTTDVCYGNSADSCAKYGRLYNWATAMNGASSSSLSPSGVQGACPVGWHVPSDAEWTALTDFVGGAATAGTKLKATSGWNNNGNGTDQYGFSALPGGNGGSDGYFHNAGDYGFWWSATEYDAGHAWYRVMNYYDGLVGRDYDSKSYLFSVRCAQD